MKKITFLMVVIIAALLMSSLVFAQTYEKVIKVSEGMGEGMHKKCSQMGDVKVEKMVKSCGANPQMMMGCGGMGCGSMAGGCSGMCKGGEKKHCCKSEFYLCCAEGLELTDEQVASLKSIKMNYLKAKIQEEADLKIAELELKELMSAEKTDMAKVEKMIKSIYIMKAEKKIAALKAQEKAKGVLTPEQLQKKKEHHKKMKGM
jgi:hypothetical protein